MQRTEDGYIIISCDFLGTDWDEQIPMIEGHKGSILSLDALALAIDGASPVDEEVGCTMCLRPIEIGDKAWRHPDPPKLPGINPHAVICWDCIQQADRGFAKDKEVEWDRKIAPTDRWR